MTDPSHHARQMDRIYRYTRHVYDLTRRYYLFGRDHLLREMIIKPGDQVLELGCGTGRNLILLRRSHPNAHFFGLDVSEQMLQTAGRAVRRSGGGISLALGFAEQLNAKDTFQLDHPFDVIFFSFSLSMMPTWQGAIDAALDNLRVGGLLYIVDFWDQAGLSYPFAHFLVNWLAMFHVHYRPELLAYLANKASAGHFKLDIRSVGRRYAYLATLLKQ